MAVLKCASTAAVSVSVGIIGGADGPTAVFVTAPPWTAAVCVLALAAGVLIYVLLRRKR